MNEEKPRVSRRNVLRSTATLGAAGLIGATVAKPAVASHGTLRHSAGDGSARIFVYHDATGDENEAKTVTDSLATFLDKCVNHGLGGYRIYYNSEAVGENFSGFGDFKDWVGSNNDYDGGHIILERTWDGNNQAASDGDNAWTGRGHSYIDMSDMDFIEEIKNLASQEMSHNFIQTYSGNEHYLGVVYWDNAVSPMATKGLDSSHYGQNGPCSKPWSWGGYYKNLASDCTADEWAESYAAYG